MPHSNILLAMGAATLLMNAERICGSPFNISTAFCSIGDSGFLPFCALSCHNCSQVACSVLLDNLPGNLIKYRKVLSVYSCAEQGDG